jgi:hypothetical protein
LANNELPDDALGKMDMGLNEGYILFPKLSESESDSAIVAASIASAAANESAVEDSVSPSGADDDAARARCI